MPQLLRSLLHVFVQFTFLCEVYIGALWKCYLCLYAASLQYDHHLVHFVFPGALCFCLELMFLSATATLNHFHVLLSCVIHELHNMQVCNKTLVSKFFNKYSGHDSLLRSFKLRNNESCRVFSIYRFRMQASVYIYSYLYYLWFDKMLHCSGSTVHSQLTC